MPCRVDPSLVNDSERKLTPRERLDYKLLEKACNKLNIKNPLNYPSFHKGRDAVIFLGEDDATIYLCRLCKGLDDDKLKDLGLYQWYSRHSALDKNREKIEDMADKWVEELK